MKNLILILAIVSICALNLVAQKNGKTTLRTATAVHESPSKNPFTIGAPTVYTDEAAFLAAIGSNYYVEDFSSYTFDSYAKDTLTITSGLFQYHILASKGGLYSSESSMSTGSNGDSLFVSNVGENINFFGGYFYSADKDGLFAQDTVSIVVGNYIKTYTCKDSLSFFGFVFTDNIPYVSISTKTRLIFPTMDHFYVGHLSIVNAENTVTKRAISISPNPVKDAFQVTGIEATATLALLDINGKLLQTKLVTANEAVSVSTLPKGVYVVKLTSSNGTTEQKLIKQ